MARITLADGTIVNTDAKREQEAHDKISALLADEAFMKRYHHESPSIRKSAIEEMTALHGILYGNNPVSHDHFVERKK